MIPEGFLVALDDPMALKITVRLNPWGATAALDGDLDMATEAPARAALDAVLTAVAARRTHSPGPVGPVGLVLDVSRVFADVRGLTVLHRLWRAGERRAVAVALSGAGPLLRRMVELLTSPGVPLYPDVAEAWNALLTMSERVERV
ncbi:Sulfate transporter/antisigma-factor antagonist STAS [Parafrankia sp. EAN1pec]|nr:Sulfate transporter/antisigma-factor antagonist STAS [Frankia sp. EAN1pec]